MTDKERRPGCERVERRASAASRWSVVRKNRLWVVRFLRFPHTLDGIELRRVGRETEQLDAMAIGAEPSLAVWSRLWHGPLSRMRKILRRDRRTRCLRNSRKVVPLKTGRSGSGNVAALERDGTEHVGGLAHAVGVDAGLDADARPGAVQACRRARSWLRRRTSRRRDTRRLFFDRWEASAQPHGLLLGIRACQSLAWPLHRETEVVE